MSIATRFGQWTPRQKLKEMREGDLARTASWFRKRLDDLEKYLGTVKFHGRPMLDEPMSANAVDAVLEEAFDALENAPDPMETMIREMAAQGRA